MAQIFPQLNGEYALNSECPDSERWHDNTLLDGVWVRDDGCWLGRVVNPGGMGEYLSVAFTADDELVPAPEGWDAYIVRELPPLGLPSKLARRAA